MEHVFCYFCEGRSRDFLVLSLSEWDTSAGLASGGSDLGVASLLPPLPHLEELLLLLLAPAAAVFLARKCLCYCCSSCTCSPKQEECSSSTQQEEESKSLFSSGRGAPPPFAGDFLKDKEGFLCCCCSCCLRGAICYAVVSFGGFREFGFVPKFLWKEKEIRIMNEARALLKDILRPMDKIHCEGNPHVADLFDSCYQQPLFSKGRACGSGSGSGVSDKFAGIDFEDEDDEDDEDEKYENEFLLHKNAEAPQGGLQGQTAAAGLRLDGLLAQLLRPKVRMQFKQRLAATRVTAHLRLRKKRNEKEENEMAPYFPPTGDGVVAPCWQKLDQAKQLQQQQEQQQDEHEHAKIHSRWCSSSFIVTFDVRGVPVDTPKITGEASVAAGADGRPPTALRRFSSFKEADGVGESAQAAGRNNRSEETQTDMLAKALAESLVYVQAPQAFQTAFLPSSAAPSVWGLPASVLLLRSTPQLPSLSSLQQINSWQKPSSPKRCEWVQRLLLQCANESCKTPLGFLADLQPIAYDQLPSNGSKWVNLAIKYFFEEIERNAINQEDTQKYYSKKDFVSEPKKVIYSTKGGEKAVEQTLLQWLQENELLSDEFIEKIRQEIQININIKMKENKFWILDTEEVQRRVRSQCDVCNKKTTEEKRSNNSICMNWSCVIRHCFPEQLVPLLDDEKASFARLKLETGLLLSPSSLAFICTYMQPLLRTRQRLLYLFKAKEEEAFLHSTTTNPALITQQNLMRQKYSQIVDKAVSWLLCGGPIKHITAFRIFGYNIFPSDSLIEVGGHTDAQRAHFWRMASANVVPREPLFLDSFKQPPECAPLLSFAEAIALSQTGRPFQGSRERSKEKENFSVSSLNLFTAAAEYIHNYEKSVSDEDMRKSAEFVQYLTEVVIARRLTWIKEKAHLQNSEKYTKYFLESWDINNNQGDKESNELKNKMQQAVLPPASSHLEESLMPSDLFDWQQRLIEYQNASTLKEMDEAFCMVSLPAEWAGDAYTTPQEELWKEQQAPITTHWRWTADEEDMQKQRAAKQAWQQEQEAKNKERQMKQLKEQKAMLERKARRLIEAMNKA